MLAFVLFLLALGLGIGHAIADKQRRCTECRMPILVGDEMLPAGEGEWMHEECEPDPDACPRGGFHAKVDGRCRKCGEVPG